tara:strand:- start:76 stop:309 length:234 start_codon:yes stop_codon:yes gene_type:complete
MERIHGPNIQSEAREEEADEVVTKSITQAWGKEEDLRQERGMLVSRNGSFILSERTVKVERREHRVFESVGRDATRS